MRIAGALIWIFGLLLASCGPSQENIQATVDAKIRTAIEAIPTPTPPPTPTPLPNIGQWTWGPNLALRVQRVMTSPLLVYGRENRYWRLLAPEGKQFVMVWVDVFQNQAGTMRLNPVSDRVELRDAKDAMYTPMPIVGGEAIESSPSGYYAPLFTEPVSLPPGNSISGWVAFLLPKEVTPRELVWDEIDRITIRLT